MGRAMLSKSIIQFSVDGRGCVPSLSFDLRPNYGGGNEDKGDSFRRPHKGTAALSAPDPAAASATHASTRDSWALPGKSGSVSCGVDAPFSWVLVCTRFCLCPPRVCFPVLCKFWQPYGGAATQSPCPYGSLLLTRTFTGDA